MKILKFLIVPGLVLMSNGLLGQQLPLSYLPVLNEIVTFFETIRGSNSITQGDNTLSLASQTRITLRIDHKKQVKNLIFEKQPDEEGNLQWIAVNELAIDMVNKYEDELTRILDSMHKLAEKKSKE
ncbi:MAG: hypothetical protein EHM20_08100 [Alphaproteobacteria bacterium]|nr:MAG: hypothetical protein EHM20_08100 [Alphaproteobacteria bacterium]